MALPAASVWEVRPTVGSDTNGGGFVTGSSGSDYSQQNSKNTSGSDISTTDAVAVGTTTLTSATANFSTAIPGNIIFLSGSGITAGWYEVVSRTNGTTVVLDRSPGTGTSLTMNIGGALATVSQAATNSVASNVVWVKASGTYTVTSTLTIALDSHTAPGNPFSIIGYTSTRGDNGQVTWTTATNSVSLITFAAANNVLIQNFIFTSTAGTVGNGWTTPGSGSANSISITAINCKFSGLNLGINGNFSLVYEFEGLFLQGCRFTGSVSHGVINGGGTYALGCQFDNNGGDGFNTGVSQTPQGPYFIFEYSIFYKNSANGINIAFSNTGGSTLPIIIISHCDVSTNTDAGYVSPNANNPLLQASNSIFDANGTYGVDTGSTSITVQALLYKNAFYNNTTAATRGVNTGIGTVTLSASPYNTIGSDFSLNSTSGGGAACKGAGFPGTIPGGGSGSADIGALQSSGGGSTTVQVIAPTQIRILKNDRR